MPCVRTVRGHVLAGAPCGANVRWMWFLLRRTMDGNAPRKLDSLAANVKLTTHPRKPRKTGFSKTTNS